MYLDYPNRFINNLKSNLKNNNDFFKFNNDQDGCINLSNYDVSICEEKTRSFLNSSPEISDIDVYPKNHIFDLIFTDWDEGTNLTIKKVKKINIGKTYSSVYYYNYKKIYLDKNKGEIFLYDNSKRNDSGGARSLTYKDLTQQVLRFVEGPVFFEIIYSFLQTVAMDDNRYFLSDIKSELSNWSLVIPAKVSGLCNKHYLNKKKFLEMEYKYNPINRSNREPLSKSLLIRKAEPYLPKNQLQKFWNIDVRNINFYSVDYEPLHL